MAFALIQSTAYAVVNSASPSQTFGSPCQSGSLLIAFVAAISGGLAPASGASADTGSTGTSITDTLGNTWKRAGVYTVGLTGIFYCESAIAGTPTVTWNIGSTPASDFKISLAEYSGQLASHPLTFAGGVASAAQQPQGGAYAPVAGCLIVMEWATNGSNVTWGSPSGITLRTNTSSQVQVWGDLQNSVAGDNHMSTNIGGSPDSIGSMAMFLPANYAPPATGYKFVRTTSGPTGINKGAGVCKAAFWGGNQGVNSIVVVIAMTNISTNTVTGVTDTIGNSYTLVGAQHQVNSLNDEIVVYATRSCIDTKNDNIITVTLSGAPANAYWVQAVEYSGALPTTILDTTVKLDSGTSNITTSITAAAASELIINVGSRGGGPCAWGSIGVQTDRTFFNNEYSNWASVNQGTGVPGISATSVAYWVGDLTVSVLGSNTMQLFSGVAGASSAIFAMNPALPAPPPSVGGSGYLIGSSNRCCSHGLTAQSVF